LQSPRPKLGDIAKGMSKNGRKGETGDLVSTRKRGENAAPRKGGGLQLLAKGLGRNRGRGHKRTDRPRQKRERSLKKRRRGKKKKNAVEGRGIALIKSRASRV